MLCDKNKTDVPILEDTGLLNISKLICPASIKVSCCLHWEMNMMSHLKSCPGDDCWIVYGNARLNSISGNVCLLSAAGKVVYMYPRGLGNTRHIWRPIWRSINLHIIKPPIDKLVVEFGWFVILKVLCCMYWEFRWGWLRISSWTSPNVDFIYHNESWF